MLLHYSLASTIEMRKPMPVLIFFFVDNLLLLPGTLQDFLVIPGVQEIYQCMFKCKTKNSCSVHLFVEPTFGF